MVMQASTDDDDDDDDVETYMSCWYLNGYIAGIFSIFHAPVLRTKSRLSGGVSRSWSGEYWKVSSIFKRLTLR